MQKQLSTTDAPEAIGPYSQAVQFGDLIFTSGQIPIDPITKSIVEGDISDQSRRSLENIKAILKNAGSSLENVIKSTIYLTDIKTFGAVNEAYSQYFKGPVLPARSCVEVSNLPKGAMVEIEVIAIKEI